MTVTVKHTKISAVADGSDPNQIQPTDWNADHTLVGFTKLAGLDAMGSGLGLVTQTAADVFTTRSLVAGSGIGITNPAGTAGNITIAVTGSYQAANSKLTGLAAMGAGIGLVVQTALDTFTTRSLAAGTGIVITNPTGSAGNPTIALDTANPLTLTGGVTIDLTSGLTALTLRSNDGTATGGPNLILDRNSPTPAAGDILAQLIWYGNDSAIADQQYGAISVTLMDPTAGAYQGRLNFQTSIAGSGLVTRWRIENGIYYGAGADTGSGRANVVGLDIAGTDIFTRLNTWSGNTNVFSGGSGTPVQLAFTDPGAGTGPVLQLYRNSSSPAAGDVGGSLAFYGMDSVAAQTLYAALYMEIADPTNGSEAGGLLFGTTIAGANIQPFRMRGGFYYAAGADPGPGRINVVDGTGLQIAGTDLFARNNTWTGAQKVYNSSGGALSIDGPAATYRLLWFDTAGVHRWRMTAGAGAESGANAGSDLDISSYSDAGGFLFIALSAVRSTGVVTIGKLNVTTLSFGGTDIFARDNTWTGLNTWTANMGLTKVSPTFVMKDPTASPLADSVVGWISAQGNNSVGTLTTYAQLLLRIGNPAAGAEAGYYVFRALNGGVSTDPVTIRQGLIVGIAGGAADKGLGSVNALSYFINGTDLFARANTWTNASHTFGPGTGSVTVGIDGGAGGNRMIDFRTAGVSRWKLFANTSAESGANAGSDFSLNNYNDAGVLITTPMIFTRATGAATFNSISTGTDVNFNNIEDGAGGVTVVWRKNSASPAANDMAAYHAFQANSSTGINRTMATLVATVLDPTNGAEDSEIKFQTYVAGTLASRWGIGGGIYYSGGSDPGVGEINVQGLNISGTDIFARANTWTGLQTFSPSPAANPAAGVDTFAIQGSGSYGGGFGLIDGTFNIGLWSNSGTLNIGFGTSLGALTSVATISPAGDVTFGSGATFNFGSTSVASATSVAIRAPAGQTKQVVYYSGTSQRWNIGANNTAEGGSNAGTNFALNAYTDAGAFIGTAILVTRSTMAATFAGDVIVNGSVLQANDADVVVNASGANHGFMRVQSATGTIHGITFRSGTNATGTGDRWRIYGGDGVAETGSNVGANFNITSYNDSGVALHTFVSIARNTGVATFGNTGGHGGFIFGNASGGAKGFGTINAVGVYDDNVLLTCYVLEAANNNFIDFERWDSFNYGRPHAPARKFATRTHVLDVDKYIAEWKETGVLPGMPSPEAWAEAGGMSTGDMIQRLWETVELLAVHIDTVNTRALAA